MLVVVLALLLQASALPADRRNTEVPDTDTHVSLATYATKADWEARRAAVRGWGFSASGVLTSAR